MSQGPRITIRPSGITAAYRGNAAHAPLDPSAWDATVAGGFAALAAPLAEAVARAGLRGRRVQVLYDSPDAVCEMLTLPLPPAEATAAGTLRIREALGSGIPASVCVCRVPTRADGSTTLLMTADREATTEAVAAAVRAAGAAPEALIPLRATTLRDAVATALALPGPRSAAVVWLDLNATAMAGGPGGQCRFARPLGTACDLLADAFRRAARAAGGCDFAAARTLLFRAGIPRREQVVDEPMNLLGEHVIPLLQPVLQRLAVEIKQTLRFGLPEGEASRVIVTLAGPGAEIPGIAQTLSAMIETTAQAAAPEVGPDREAIAASMRVGFTPASVRERRTRRGLAAAALLGAASAALAVGADLAWTRAETRRLEQTIAANHQRLEQARDDAAVDARLAATSDELARLDALTLGTVGDQAPWAAALHALSTLAAPGLEVHEIAGGLTPDGPVLTIRGAVPGSAADGRPVAGLIESLSASPLAARVQVASTRAVQTDAGPRVQFSLAITLRTLSRTALAQTPTSPTAPTSTPDGR